MANRVSNQRLVLLSVLGILFLASVGCQRKDASSVVQRKDPAIGKDGFYKDNQVLMGTFVEVISPDKRASKIVFAEIQRVERLMSKYDANSEVARLNSLGSLKVSPETFALVKRAKEFWQASDGAFDITVGPLMELWGFHSKKYYLPREGEVQKVMPLIGMDKINLDENEFVIQLAVPGMKIDLGGIAKGYAVDCAIAKLREAGVESCLINAGGQIHCLGENSGNPWKVGVRCPRSDEFCGVIELEDQAVATSGDYEQYFIREGKRYSHILNPKTGYPAQQGVVSVTVVAPDGVTADALATAIFVLGKEKGKELAKQYGRVKVRIITEDELESVAKPQD